MYLISQYIKKLFAKRIFRQRNVFDFSLWLITGVIISYAMAICFTAPGTLATTYTTSWIGNSFGGGDKWVQIQISGMYVDSNGTVYTNSPWDEGGREVGIYQNGDIIGQAADLHGWGRSGGVAVTASGQYLYVAMQQSNSGHPGEDYPPQGIDWHCVRRYDLSGKPAPFSGGRGHDQSMLIVSTKHEVTGLATARGELYVSDKEDNKVHVYSTETMKELRNFSVANPGKIAIDSQGNLWIIQEKGHSTPAKILQYSREGTKLSKTITDVENPSAIAINNQGKLLVAENGQAQQVLVYNITNQAVQVGSFGIKGGIYTGIPGEVKDLKFAGLSGVGTDAAGNIYISNDGFNRSGVDLRVFSPSGKLKSRLLGLNFIDNADVDPMTDGLDVYTKHHHYIMDYSKTNGKEWTDKGYTLNAVKYPQDPRLHTGMDGTFFRRIHGKPFLFLTNMYGDMLELFRFQKDTDGEIAIPSGMFVATSPNSKRIFQGDWPPNQPEEGEWIWRDGNGNGKFDAGEYVSSKDNPYVGGWWVDSKGDVWKALRTQDGVGIRHYPLQGFDAHGNPIYTYASMKKQSHPSIFTDLRRLEYYPETDTMYLSGYTKAHPTIHSDYAKLIGSEIARFDHWSQGNRTPRWRIVVPTDVTSPPDVLTPAAMSVAGNYVFIVTSKTAEVYAYNTTTGKQVQKLKPGKEVASESGWVDIPYGIRAFRRANGEYLVFVEEDLKGKVIMYRLHLA